MESFTPQLKEKLCQSITKELAQADTQENSPAATNSAYPATQKRNTINDDLENALQEHLRSIGKLFISQNLNPSDQLTNVLLLSKLKQYKSL